MAQDKNTLKITSRNYLSVPDGRYLIEPSLYLVVRREGQSRGYVFRYTFGGKRRDLSLGDAKVKNLTVAKADGVECRRLLAQGIDPLEERERAREEREKEAAGPITFRQYFDENIDEILEFRQYKNPKTAQDFKNLLVKYVLGVLGDMPLNEIETKDLVVLFESLWFEKPSISNKILFLLNFIFKWAKRDGIRTNPNPAVWEDNLDAYFPSVNTLIAKKRQHRLSPELGKLTGFLLEELRRGYIGGYACTAIALGAARKNELLMLKWSEVDFEKRVISVPPERRKDKKQEPFRIPMSDQMCFLLKALPRDEEHVFHVPGKKTPCDLRIYQVYINKRIDGSIHGMRSTFSDWAAEKGINWTLAEKSLMHATGSSVHQAYQRSDLLEQRREVMQKWADELLSMRELKKALAPVRTGR